MLTIFAAWLRTEVDTFSELQFWELKLTSEAYLFNPESSLPHPGPYLPVWTGHACLPCVSSHTQSLAAQFFPHRCAKFRPAYSLLWVSCSPHPLSSGQSCSCTAPSYPSIENSFNGCQGHPPFRLPPGTAQRLPDRIQKVFGHAAIYSANSFFFFSYAGHGRTVAFILSISVQQFSTTFFNNSHNYMIYTLRLQYCAWGTPSALH
jgi:hypothetical protein